MNHYIAHIFFSFILVTASHIAHGQAAPPINPEATRLETGQAIEREIGGGENHFFHVEVGAGQFLRLEVVTNGRSMGLHLRMPDGTNQALYDPIGIIAEKMEVERVAIEPGIYQFRVFVGSKAKPGKYRIILTDQRKATDRDKELQLARDLIREHRRLTRAGKEVESQPVLIRANEIRERLLGPDDLRLAQSISLLAGSYLRSGNYARSEEHYLRELKILSKVFGPVHSQIANSYRELGILYYEKGDYSKAAESLEKGLEIYERVGQSEDLIFASTLSYLGHIYRHWDDLEKALALYRRSLAIREKLLGPESYHNIHSLESFARVAYDSGDYAAAESFLNRALKLTEKEFGPEHLKVTWILCALGDIYIARGDYEQAERLFKRALAIEERVTGMMTQDAAVTLLGLAHIYSAQNRVADAIKFATQASEIEERILSLNLSVGSEREKLTLLDEMGLLVHRHISLHVNHAPDDANALKLALTTILRRKGRVQDALSDEMASLRQRSDTNGQEAITQIGNVNSQLASLTLNVPPKDSPGEYQKKIKALADEKERLEAELSRSDPGFRTRSAKVSIEAITAAIPESAALVEFALYRPFDPRKTTKKTAFAEPRYVAYVVDSKGDQRWKDLGSAELIDRRVRAWREALRDPLRKDERRLSREVDELVMRPVRSLLGDLKHLLISPDGELNLIPFAALMDEQKRLLIERYQITYLTSGRDLLRSRIESSGHDAPLVIADPAFSDGMHVGTEKRRAATRRKSIVVTRSLSETYFAPLSGTAGEARSIQSMFPNANLLSGSDASETNLKKATVPSVLHVASHGFFLENADRKFKIDNPLLRSGLALAGANRRGVADHDDGILTALEASGLNLWGTRLVVLSACDTGVGEVKNGEGVYGLRRAFVLAGTESLVMSLWSVSDYTTRELMSRFYKNLKAGMGRGDSLRQAQLELLKQKGRQHPFYWAPFIHAGEWANLDGKR